jgi:hypothetical protein
MRSPRHVLSLVLALALVGAACGEDAEPAPVDRAEPGDVTDAGAEGAFGQVDDCGRLAEEAVAAYGRVVAELGDAQRTDTERIDAALDSFGGLGPDLNVRAEALDCDDDAVQAQVCAAVVTLEPGGPAAQDVVDRVRSGCADDA